MTYEVNVDKDGDLNIEGQLILFRYPAGDYDTFSWPLHSCGMGTDPKWKTRMMLAEALYGLRESGCIPPSCNTVKLPDESLFDIDEESAHSDHPHIEDWDDWKQSIRPW